MPIERTVPRQNPGDVLDRVLDKGIVIDAWVRVCLVGLELVTVEARMVVASIETYRGYAPTLTGLVQTPPSGEGAETAEPGPCRSAVAAWARGLG